MREIMIGCLLSFIKAENFAAKAIFVKERQGLEKLSGWLTISGDEQEQKYGKAAQLRKIRLKLLQLTSDLCLNDDSIYGKGTFVRDFFGKQQAVISHLCATIESADLEVAQEY